MYEFEDTLKRKTAHFRLSSVDQKRHVLKLSNGAMMTPVNISLLYLSLHAVAHKK